MTEHDEKIVDCMDTNENSSAIMETKRASMKKFRIDQDFLIEH